MTDPVVPAPTPEKQPAPPVPVPTPAPAVVALVSLDEFKRVKLTTAEVVSAVPHPKADRLMILQIKVGERNKQIVAGIRQFYTPEQLVGRTIVIVDNLQPARLRGEESQGMLLAVRLADGGLRLLATDGPAASGLEIS
jgi:methionine--tRNA ligase beta chain